MAVRYAKAMGLEVIAVDTSVHQLDTAKILEADYTINPTICPSYANDVKRLTNRGVDAALNFTPFKDVYDDMPSMLRWGGILMLVGVTEEPLSFDCMDLIFQRYIIKAAMERQRTLASVSALVPGTRSSFWRSSRSWRKFPLRSR